MQRFPFPKELPNLDDEESLVWLLEFGGILSCGMLKDAVEMKGKGGFISMYDNLLLETEETDMNILGVNGLILFEDVRKQISELSIGNQFIGLLQNSIKNEGILFIKLRYSEKLLMVKIKT